MLVHEDFRAETARRRQAEAERIAIRMGFHSAFVRATAIRSVAADRAWTRARARHDGDRMVRRWRRLAGLHRASGTAAG